jgi:PBSX family phage terminase large subunit
MLSRKAINYIRAPAARINILHGSIRSSKTTNALMLLPERVISAPPGAVIITGRTVESVYRNIIRPAQDMFGTKRIKYVRGTREGSVAGRSFYVFGGNNEASENALRGLTVSYWHADEVTLNPESFIKQCLGRMSPEGACADWTTNPGPPSHFLKTDFIDRESELDARVWHFTLDDNPNLPAAYVESIKREYQPGSLFYKRFIDGEWVLAEGVIYGAFNDRQHVLKELPGVAPDDLILAGDYGTNNPTSVGLYGIYKNRVPMVVRLAGYYYDGRTHQRTDTEHAEAIDAWLGDVNADLELWKPDVLPRKAIRLVLLDPSAASFKTQLRRGGWKVQDANNDVTDGIRTQARMLHEGSYVLGPHPSNAQARTDYGQYVWDEKAQGRGLDKPLKNNDHTKDEERYLLHTLFGRGRTDPKRIRAAMGI